MIRPLNFLPAAFKRCVLSEFLTESHTETLKDIIRGLAAGDYPQALMERFEQGCHGLTADEISEVFTQLDKEGVSFQNHPQVINYYHTIITNKLSAGIISQFAPGHPARVYLEENQLLRSLFARIHQVDLYMERERFQKIFQQISRVEIHYTRKENQLFPRLEQHGWDSPSKNMWAFHDEIRALIKVVNEALEAGDLDTVARQFPTLEGEMMRLIAVEEERLIPNALNMLEEAEWAAMGAGDAEIGWMLDEAPPAYPATTEEAEYVHPSRVEASAAAPPAATDATYHYDEGYMTPEQVNLIFRHLPLDITYVDENDKVVFYNRGDERVFPRSPGIIGREVRYCHPPKSVDTVLRILEAFKAGTRNQADFRIHVKGRYILIRYFAVRDEAQNYRGVIEMSQDITDIVTLQGEQRLLDWD